ncbi:DUF2254 family protein [Sneathiella glossodoripedis]|uniref:DUF2254 family protein n=1 Tax=Sneathiella glossodoripedis TaxID=418853 RepID=UPI000AF22A29|nr:DUF2254 family protein [Sneathiella glossodoripedis]
MRDKLRYLLNRMGELLWIRPLIICLLSISMAFLARLVDNSGIDHLLPNVTVESLNTLLSIISASMLVIATFAVGAMISAYSNASRTATPRSFTLVVADDVSQNALSAFVGSFIFSIVALIALQNGLYGNAGRFVLFSLTLFVFIVVIVTFIRWVDRVARLGRLEETIDKVENATLEALERRRFIPRWGQVRSRRGRKYLNPYSRTGLVIFSNWIYS